MRYPVLVGDCRLLVEDSTGLGPDELMHLQEAGSLLEGGMHQVRLLHRLQDADSESLCSRDAYSTNPYIRHTFQANSAC